MRMNNLLTFPRIPCDLETFIVWANIKISYVLKIKVTNHYRFAGLGFGKSRMNASCARIHAAKTASISHDAVPSFRVDLKYL